MIITVVWFKRDLRVNDHQPLYFAQQQGQVLPLYVIEPDLWKQQDSSQYHWHFIHDSLKNLDAELKLLGASLCVKIGDILSVLQQLKNDLGAFQLFSHEETGNDWTFNRDKKVYNWCKSARVEWLEFPSHGVVRRLVARDTWMMQRMQRMNKDILPSPGVISMPETIVSDCLLEKNHKLFGQAVTAKLQTGGRFMAEYVLNSFLKERGQKYMYYISKPGLSRRSCSRLSPHITYGTLSMREIEQATRAKLDALKALSHDAEAQTFRKHLAAFLSRLSWHCHFMQKLEQQPSIEFKCMHSAFEAMRVRGSRNDYLQAWISGQTGYPLVDACMRFLRRHGWINFRMRAMLVSFASYHLWLDWRDTAPLLAQLFTDYEPGIHYSQFQMQSGVTGINSIRMYNPIKQSYEHDSQGRFIREYIPELASIEDVYIHEPWQRPLPIKGYPPPIIFHDIAVQHARTEIKKYQQSDGFKEEAKKIIKKLASRKKATRPANNPRGKNIKKSTGVEQLSFDFSIISSENEG